MTAEQRIKRHLLKEWGREGSEKEWGGSEEDWKAILEEDWHRYDYLEEFRESGERTGIEEDATRDYKATSVGRQLSDGSWVGWIFWSGGGKHADPEGIPWLEHAYMLDVTQETRTVNVFKKAGEAGDE